MLSKLFSLLKSNATTDWKIEDFSGIDQLHLGGMPATLALLEWLPSDAKQGLDIGCGLGGTSRVLCSTRACNMQGLDLNEQYIKAAKLINKLTQPQAQCQYVVGNSLYLPFAKHSFDFVISQHACMNIAQKQRLLQGLFNVIKPQGQLLLHEIMLGPQAVEADVLYPTPWAQNKDESHLCDWHSFAQFAITAGFKIEHFNEHSEAALAWIKQTRLQTSNSPFTPTLVLGSSAPLMSRNLAHNITAGALQVVSVCLRKA